MAMSEFKSKMQFVFQYLNKSISDLVRAGRSVKIIEAPQTPGQTIEVTIRNVETVLKFTNINVNFNVFLIYDDCLKLGDKLYIILDTIGSSGGQITFTSGNIAINGCGGSNPPQNLYTTQNNEVVIIPFLYNCDKFYGLDYC